MHISRHEREDASFAFVAQEKMHLCGAKEKMPCATLMSHNRLPCATLTESCAPQSAAVRHIDEPQSAAVHHSR